MDPLLSLAGFFIGTVVGLTGMGGGALMTPVLVLFFGIPPLTAVSSDLVVSAVMKPVGAFVHLRRGSVVLPIVGWLCIGSVPAAFCGVFIIKALGDSEGVQNVTKLALGVALIVATVGLLYRSYLRMVEKAKVRAGTVPPPVEGPVVIKARPIPTIITGAVGGVVVGMTSVGSGSLIIIALLTLYPMMKAGGLVGTDLVQAVPLVLSAAIAHIVFGDFELSLTAALLIGCLPGVYLGAKLSAYAPDGIVRRALTFVLLASALKLLGASNVLTVILLAATLVLLPLLWAYLRTRNGLPASSHVLRQLLPKRPSGPTADLPGAAAPGAAAPRAAVAGAVVAGADRPATGQPAAEARETDPRHADQPTG